MSELVPLYILADVVGATCPSAFWRASLPSVSVCSCVAGHRSGCRCEQRSALSSAAALTPVVMPPRPLPQARLGEFLKGYDAVVLLLGFGARAGYGDLPGAYADVRARLAHVFANVAPELSITPKPSRDWLLVFGGDTAIESKPDLGMLVKRLRSTTAPWPAPLGARSEWSVAPTVLAVQCWEEVDDHIDFVYVYPSDWHEGRQLWGGVVDGRPRAATAVYLGPEITPRLTAVIAAGGGGIAAQELRYAATLSGVPVHYVRAQARDVTAYNGLYGPLDTEAGEYISTVPQLNRAWIRQPCLYACIFVAAWVACTLLRGRAARLK